MKILDRYKSAPHIKRLPLEEWDTAYKKYRINCFIGIFIGYAGYYLLRGNFALAMPHLLAEGAYSKSKLGLILSAITISYGISKFLMGNLSDRSNPRYFLATGLIFSALINLFFSFIPGITSSLIFMYSLMFLNGWTQGMGAPPCYRIVSHWFSISERGRIMAVWNTSHNIGAGLLGASAVILTSYFSWKSIFYVPAIFALIIAIFIIILMRDTPQSVGLAPIEEYKNEYPPIKKNTEDYEKELTGKEILFKHVLVNKFVWFLGMANIFVYFIRYGVLNWAPTYLTEIKGISSSSSGWAFFNYELAGIIGMLLCGYLSDKLVKGNRAPISILCMIIVCIGIFLYWLNPYIIINHLALLLIGMFIYGPIMLTGVQVLDLIPKKAVGTTIGLLGLFGYWGGTMSASLGFGYLVDLFGWKIGFITLIISCGLAIFFFSLTLIPSKNKNL